MGQKFGNKIRDLIELIATENITQIIEEWILKYESLYLGKFY